MSPVTTDIEPLKGLIHTDQSAECRQISKTSQRKGIYLSSYIKRTNHNLTKPQEGQQNNPATVGYKPTSSRQSDAAYWKMLTLAMQLDQIRALYRYRVEQAIQSPWKKNPKMVNPWLCSSLQSSHWVGLTSYNGIWKTREGEALLSSSTIWEDMEGVQN